MRNVKWLPVLTVVLVVLSFVAVLAGWVALAQPLGLAAIAFAVLGLQDDS